MPSINTIRTVTIRQVSEGADTVRRDLDGLVAAQERVAQASDQTATVTETSARRQLSAASALDKLRAMADAAFRAQQQLERGTTTLDRAFAQGIVDSTGYDRVLGQLRSRFDEASAAAARLSTEQRAVARDTIAARDAAEAAARSYQTTINARTGVSSGAGGDRVADFQAAADAADRLRAKLDPLYAAQRAYRTDLTELRGALSAGIVSEDAYTAALNRRKEAFTEQAAALGKISAAERLAATAAADSAAATDRATKGWAGLSAQGAAVSSRLDFNSDFTRRMSAASAGAAVPANQNARIDFSKAQQANLLNLAQQAPDVFGSLYGGISPLTTFIQQGPQIAQSFAGPGALSMSGVFQAATDKASSLASRIGVVGGAIGALTLAVGAGAIAWLNYRSEQSEVEKRLSGVGRLSGVTRASISDLATSTAAQGMSRTTARDVGSIYAGTGRIGSDLLGGAVSATRDFSAFLGVDASAGATELAGALSDVTKGAGDLAARYGLLNAATVESIQRMEAQGDRLGATRRLIDEVRNSTRGLAEETTGWGKVTDWVSDRWSALGQGVDKALTGGNLDERLASARDRLTTARSEAGSSMFEFGSGYSVQDEEKNVARLEKLAEARDRVTAQANQAIRSQQIAATVRSLDPERQEFQRLTDSVTLLRKAITDPMKFGLDSQALAEAEAAFGRVSRLAQTMRQDIEKYGTTTVADLNRTAAFEARTVGATPYGRSAASINEEIEARARRTGVDLTGGRSVSEVETGYRNRNTDFNLDQAGLYNRYQEELRTAREREGLLSARDTQLESARRTESLSLVPQAGAFSRLSPDLQQRILSVGQQPGNLAIPPAIVAAIAERESSSNPNIGYSRERNPDGSPSSAFGLGQITAGTARDASRLGYLPPGFDRTNPDTMVEGIYGALNMKRAATGGDMTRALDNYGTGPGYGLNIMRRAGQLGDASSLAEARSQDEATRAVRDSNEALDRAKRYYGENGAALDASSAAARRYNQLLDAGVRPSDALAASLRELETRSTAAARATNLVQYLRDDDFARAQLGRDRIDQQAYSTARSRFGDTTSPEAQAVISRTRDTLNLGETRSLFSDSITSFASELRRGGDAAAALSNTLGNVIDKLAGKAIDSLVGSAFSQFAGAGSSGANPISSFFSSFFGGAHADGGLLYGPGGPRTDNLLIRASPGEYVINAEATARNRGLLDAINYGGHFADGGMISPGEARDLWSAAPMPSPANANGAPPNITFVTPPGVNLEADGPAQRRSDGSYEQVLKTVEKGLGGRAANQRGPFQGAVGGAWARKG